MKRILCLPLVATPRGQMDQQETQDGWRGDRCVREAKSGKRSLS